MKQYSNLTSEVFAKACSFISSIKNYKHNCDEYCENDFYIIKNGHKNTFFHSNFYFKIFFYDKNYMDFAINLNNCLNENDIIDKIEKLYSNYIQNFKCKFHKTYITDIPCNFYFIEEYNHLLYIDMFEKYLLIIRPYYHGICLKSYICNYQENYNCEFSKTMGISDSTLYFLNKINYESKKQNTNMLFCLTKQNIFKALLSKVISENLVNVNLKPSNIIITSNGIIFVDHFDSIFYSAIYHGDATNNYNSDSIYNTISFITEGYFEKNSILYNFCIIIIDLFIGPSKNSLSVKKKVDKLKDYIDEKIINIIKHNLGNDNYMSFNY